MSPTSSPSADLQPTHRSTVQRGKHRTVTDRSALHAFLASQLVAHLGVDAGSHPVVLPMAYALDLDGPDRDGTLYLHGSHASRWFRDAVDRQVCVTVTELTGLVLAQRAFAHSVNYRCAVVIGTARGVRDPAEVHRALDLLVDQQVPGRSAHLPAHTRKELAATGVFAVSLHEASMKERAGEPGDDLVDPAAWAGHVPLRQVASPAVTAGYGSGPVPEHVTRRVQGLNGAGRREPRPGDSIGCTHD